MPPVRPLAYEYIGQSPNRGRSPSSSRATGEASLAAHPAAQPLQTGFWGKENTRLRVCF